MISFECHSPIIACVNGRPAFYLRQPHDTWKGQMWRDIGLPEWIFETDATTGATIAERLLDIHRNYGAAQRKLKEAMHCARRRQQATMKILRQTLG